LDIRARFHQSPKEIDIHDHLILARAGDRQVALRVDRAVDLVRIPDKDVDRTAELMPGSEYIKGVARLSDGLVLIHDLGAFLTEAESADLDSSLSNRQKDLS
jgi:purine-binding chemotaxis protein CheW